MNMAYSNDVQIQGKAYSLSERPVKNDDGIMAEGLGGDRTKVFSGHDRRDMRRMGKKQVRAVEKPIAFIRADRE